MKEEAWLTCVDPDPMVRFLQKRGRQRKLRLFACACCRRVWDLLIHPKTRNAVEVAERFASARVSDEQRIDAYMSAAQEAACWVNGGGADWSAIASAASAAAFAVANKSTLEEETIAAGEYVMNNLYLADAIYRDADRSPLLLAVLESASAVASAVIAWAETEEERLHSSLEESHLLQEKDEREEWQTTAIMAGTMRTAALGVTFADLSDYSAAWERMRVIERETQCAVLRDLVPNPFTTPRFDPAWCTADVLALARGIENDRAFDRMPILADALQDAGCDNDDILNHCRTADATHVPGYWALDLCLGLE